MLFNSFLRLYAMYSNEQKIIIIAILAAIFLVAVLVYFIATFTKQHKKIVAWQQARIKAEVEILESERKRIATDLHDEVGPLLSVIKAQINELQTTNDIEEIILGKSNKQIDEVIQKFRNISYNLLPNTLVRKGVVFATQEFIEKLEQGHLKIIFKADAIAINTDTAINIFRILQEIIHNTIKHSRATTLNITLVNTAINIELITADDGIGFEYNEQQQINNGLGLLSLSSRVEILKGTMKIETAVGKGVRYVITIPKSK